MLPSIYTQLMTRVWDFMSMRILYMDALYAYYLSFLQDDVNKIYLTLSSSTTDSTVDVSAPVIETMRALFSTDECTIRSSIFNIILNKYTIR